jgi:hypothetical protein
VLPRARVPTGDQGFAAWSMRLDSQVQGESYRSRDRLIVLLGLGEEVMPPAGADPCLQPRKF